MSAQQWQDCFCIELAISKVQHIFFLKPSTLLLLHVPNIYSIVQIEDRNTHRIVKQGKVSPVLMEKVSIYDQKSIVYNYGNQLHLFDLMEGRSVCQYTIPESEIYEEQFEFQLSQEQSKVVFFKTSMLKSTPLTIYYDVHLLDVGKQFTQLKKCKAEHPDLRKFGFCSGQFFSYQISGYTIQICFIESGVFHKINSIYNIFLVDIVVKKDNMLLHFTHQDLDHELTTYDVSKKRLKKMERKANPFQPHVYSNQTGSHSIVYKNCFNHKKRDGFAGIFRVKALRPIKYLKILDKVLPEQTEKDFKQQVLNLLL